jgi:hypothetical protein
MKPEEGIGCSHDEEVTGCVGGDLLSNVSCYPYMRSSPTRKLLIIKQLPAIDMM